MGAYAGNGSGGSGDKRARGRQRNLESRERRYVGAKMGESLLIKIFPVFRLLVRVVNVFCLLVYFKEPLSRHLELLVSDCWGQI